MLKLWFEILYYKFADGVTSLNPDVKINTSGGFRIFERRFQLDKKMPAQFELKTKTKNFNKKVTDLHIPFSAIFFSHILPYSNKTTVFLYY